MGLDHTIELADVKHVLDGGISFLRCMAFPPPQAPGSSVYARDAFNEDGDLMAERIVRGQSNAVLRAAGDGAQI